MSDLKQTPLHALHVSLGGKMVPFAGYDLPVQYSLGVMKEHIHTRTKAGLFDVSHMGQVIVHGPSYEAAATGLETLIPVNILGLGVGRQRYGFFTNEDGGIEDDLMLANRGDHVFVVVNAACKAADIAHMREALEPEVTVTEITNRALLALQGPAAEPVLSVLDPRAAQMRFMDVATLNLDGVEVWASRSGYTGEDGYEISVPADAAERIAKKLLDHPDVEAIGLGARDSLRLEAGLCLYGHDIDETTTPVEADLAWVIQKVRRAGDERAGGFPGAERILCQLDSTITQKRVGLLPAGRAPMREGISLFETEDAPDPIGTITSGGFGPTVGAPVAMGYVGADNATPGNTLYGELRGKRLPLTVTKMPFTPANFKR
ncbi:glycine cleavage system aminomethyltransferase GcvT [uncultured Tateyamaria sp.]|uniref:glycine cleavage system aminomethyltransferase GcvT n=1 Tax=uncultured Tateyamaria sp. TaxID=455651 RepID=UPI00261D6726|nr:glycine cleavage system aminomethyltransferase GcvT [uncultured Tateyamaria sp.]